MNQMNSCKPQFKAKVPVIILSAISWLFLSLWFVYSFNGYFSTRPIYYFTRFVQPLPCLLMFLFALVFYRTRKANLFAMFVFLSAAIVPSVELVMVVIDEYVSVTYLFTSILYYSAIPLLILAGISRGKGSSNKVLVIIAMALMILAEFIWFLDWIPNFVDYLRYELHGYGIFLLLRYLGFFLLYTALLLFGLNPVKAPTPALDPEQALNLLYERRCREEISAEEYQAQRAEIIRNL